MKKMTEQYSGRGRADVKSPRQKPLGDLLREAREAMDWTRERLSTATNIGTSSIVRYELAGKEPEGQYPRSPALAKLCIALKIDPLKAMLACLPNEDYGMYETLSNDQVWKYNHPQYEWVERQLETALKDNMVLRSFIEHFTPYIDRDKLPDELHWLLDKGLDTIDRLTDLETRMLQTGVFILPFGSFMMPGGVLDEDQQNWIFDFDKKGVIDRNDVHKVRAIMRQSLSYYAKRFTQLAYQIENLEEERARYDDQLYKITGGREGRPMNEKNPEEDLPSPPGSNPATPNVSENDDGQPST